MVCATLNLAYSKEHCYRLKSLGLDKRINSCIGVTQENLMEIPLQSSLSYILLPMVRAYYYAPYPK